MPLFILGTYSRSGGDLNEITPQTRLVISLAAPVASLIVYAGCVAIFRGRSVARKAWFPPLLWAIAGAVTGVTAALLRSWAAGESRADGVTILLSAVFAVIVVGVATMGVSLFVFRQGQIRLLAQRQTQLLDLKNQAAGFAAEQSRQLRTVVSHVVAPEIERLRHEIAELNASSSMDRLKTLHDEVGEYSHDVVRTTSHEMSARRLTPEVVVATDVPPWRSVLGIMGSARVNGPLTFLAALLLLIAQFNLGCIGVPFVAVSAFVGVTVALGALGRLGPLGRPPWSFAWLTLVTALGFLVYRAVLVAAPTNCTWTETPAEVVLSTLTAIVMLLGLTVVVEASRQAALNVRALEETNEELAGVTRRLNLVGALTREQVAEFLHGPVQGRLAAISLAIRLHMDRLERGVSPSTIALRTRVDVILDEISADLQRLAGESDEPRLGAEERLSAVGRHWRGFMHIAIDADDVSIEFLDLHPEWIDRVMQCIEEAITNASRHGEARTVAVTCRLEGASTLVLDVIDDGIGVASDTRVGMGLEGVSASGGAWHFIPLQRKGAHLRVIWSVD